MAARHRLAANGWDPDLADYYRLAKLDLTVAPDFDATCREAEHAAILQGTCGVKIAVSRDQADDVCGAVSEDGIYHDCVDRGLIG